MDTLKGAALIATFIGVLVVFDLGIAMGECVARVGGACSRCNLRCSTQSPWPFPMPSLIMDVVADGGLSIDIAPNLGWGMNGHITKAESRLPSACAFLVDGSVGLFREVKHQLDPRDI